MQQEGSMGAEEPGLTGEHFRRMESNQMKKRGPGRPTLSLWDRKRLEKATRNKERRRVDR
jgi:hypothetical protein